MDGDAIIFIFIVAYFLFLLWQISHCCCVFREENYNYLISFVYLFISGEIDTWLICYIVNIADSVEDGEKVVQTALDAYGKIGMYV